MAKYLPVDRAVLSRSVLELKGQVDIRYDLISQCVGTLYASVLADEIQKLKNRLSELQSPSGDFTI